MGSDSSNDEVIGRGRSESLILLAIVVTMIANQSAIVIISPLAVAIADEFDVTVSLSGQLRTVAALISAFLAPFVGLVSDRIGRRPIMSLGLLAIIVFGLASSVAPTFAILMAVQTVAGFGVAALLSSGYAVVADAFPRERRARAVGIISIGQPLAWVVGLPLVGVVADSAGWRWSFIAVPVLFSLIAFLFIRFIPSTQSESGSNGARERPIAALKSILTVPSARSWILAELTAYSGWAGTLVFLGAYYITIHGRSTSLTGVLLALTAVAFACGSLSSNRIMAWTGLKQGIALAAGLSALALISTMLLNPGVWTSLGLLMLFGLFQGVRGAAASVLGLMQSPEHQGVMMGFRASVVQLGYVTGGIVGGVLLAAGGFALLAVIFGLLIVLASIFMAVSVESESEPEVTR